MPRTMTADDLYEQHRQRALEHLPDDADALAVAQVHATLALAAATTAGAERVAAAIDRIPDPREPY